MSRGHTVEGSWRVWAPSRSIGVCPRFGAPRGLGASGEGLESLVVSPLWVTPSTKSWAQIQVHLGYRGQAMGLGKPRPLHSSSGFGFSLNLERSQGENVALLYTGLESV